MDISKNKNVRINIMPIKVADSLPATTTLERENIFVMTEYRAMHQDIRPLNVLILNLMPTKIVTETQLLRKLSNTPLQVNVEFLQTASYIPQHTDSNHLESFYTTFDQVKDRKYDGMIITGAPLDYVRFEDVTYWDELCTIMAWGKKHVHCTLHLCWGAFAGLYYFYWTATTWTPNCPASTPTGSLREILRFSGDLMIFSMLPSPVPWASRPRRSPLFPIWS